MTNYVDILTYRIVPKKINPTAKGNKVVYGPIISKRSYHSLGINLWPYGKVCNFDCIYCCCGKSSKSNNLVMPLEQIKQEIRSGLEFHLKNNSFIQDILVEGNGEPTLHPHFSEITDYVIELRNQYFPNIPLVLFTNSTNLKEKIVIDSILKYDQAFFKLDCINDNTLKKVNGFNGSIKTLVDNLKEVGNLINTKKHNLKNFEISTAVVNSPEGNICDLYSDMFSKIIIELNPQKIYFYYKKRFN